MGYSGKKIYAPVSFADVNAVLGTNYSTLNELCTCNALKNGKWSKFKPVAHTIKFGSGSASALTEAQAKGADSQITDGIIYGLKVGQGVNGWQNLHQCTYEYVGLPDGVNFPYRLMDFAGYDHNASPTMQGSIVNNTINPNNVSIRCGILWNDTNNTTGIDILKMVAGDANINNYYVNVLVGTYAKTCTNLKSNVNAVTPIVYNGSKQDLFGVSDIPSVYGNGSKPLCTFFLAPVKLDSWKDVSKETALTDQVAIALPNAAGVELTITTGNASYGSFTLGAVTQLGATISQQITCTAAPTETGYYRLSIRINGAIKSGDFRITAGQTNIIAPSIAHGVLTSGSYSYSSNLYRLNEQGGTSVSTLATATGSITITV